MLLAGFIVTPLFIQVYSNGSARVNLSRATIHSAEDPLVYVAEPYANSIAVVDTKSSAVITLPLDESYAHFVAVPSKGILYATPYDANSSTLYALSIHDLNIVATIQVGQGVHQLTVTPDGGMQLDSINADTFDLATVADLGGVLHGVILVP